jgi:hydroxymethylpyrimidine/phosphomethylpyrimidine kinase
MDVMARARLLVIGGMDPSGGAGLLRDAWTVAQRGPELELHAVCTGLTRQGEGGPARASATPTAVLEAELERAATLERLRAVKLGMIPAEQVPAIEGLLARFALRAERDRPWIVCDPVATASAGGRLGAPATALLQLAGQLDLVTPNRAEAAEFAAAGGWPATVAVLDKAVSDADERPGSVRDRLRGPGLAEQVFERARVPGPDPRGTGCALASAIACELAHTPRDPAHASMPSLVTAVAAAIAWLDDARRHLTRVGDSWHLTLP